MGYNNTTMPDITESCPPHMRAYFETVGSSVPYLVNAGLNVLLAITTTFANLLVLLAMPHVTSVRLSSKLLLCTLILTDLGTGFVVHPQLTAFLVMKASASYNCGLATSVLFISTLLTSVSLLTMTAISLDRYAALFYHIKYHEVVTTKRVSTALIFILLFSLVFASTWLWILVLKTFITITGIVLCILIISGSYARIYRGLRVQHGQYIQDHIQTQQQTGNAFDMAKYKRTASAMLWVYVLFILCYVPFFCMNLTIAAFTKTALTQCIYEYSVTIALVNSCLNPFVYCLRLPEVQTEVLKQLRRFCCRSPQQ